MESKFPAPSVNCTAPAVPVATADPAPTCTQEVFPAPPAIYSLPFTVSMASDPVAFDEIPVGEPEATKKFARLAPFESAKIEEVVEVVAIVSTELETLFVPIPTFVVEVATNNLEMPLVINCKALDVSDPIEKVWFEAFIFRACFGFSTHLEFRFYWCWKI